MFYAESTGGFYVAAIHGDNIPKDAIEITSELHAALLDGQSQGKTIGADGGGAPILIDPPEPTRDQVLAQYESELDAHLDRVAQQYRYRDRVTFALRSGYPGPYQAEGAAFGSWMDTCNAQAYALMAAVLVGDAELPTVVEFLASLPEFVKP